MGSVCTCQEIDKWTNHQEHCALWGDLGFLRGTSAWHPTETRLVTFLEWLEDHPGSWSEKLDEWPALVRVHEWGEERHTDLMNQGQDSDAAEEAVVQEVVDGLGIPRDTVPEEPAEEPLNDMDAFLEVLAQEALNDIQSMADTMPPADNETTEDGAVLQVPKIAYRCPHCKSLEMMCSECGFHCTLCDCITPEPLYCVGCQHMSTRPDPDARPEPEDEGPEPMKSKNKGGNTGKATKSSGKTNQNQKPKGPPTCNCIGECLKKTDHAPKEPKCSCKTECKLWCSVAKVERAKQEDPWHWAEPYCSCQPAKVNNLFCYTCKVERKKTTDPWQWDQKPIDYMGGYASTTTFSKCRHYEFPLVYPNGVTIYASSLTTRKEEDPAPDFGIYCASSWDPACLAYMIAWPDYGTPKFKKAAVAAIKEGYERAKSGQKVEVGCIGGHGRTGTALACMAFLARTP
jgi:hypothetical protein